MNGVTSIIPGGRDPLFVRDQAGVANHFGYEDQPNGEILLVYPVDAFDAVQAVLTDYDGLFLRERLIPAALERAWQLRKDNMARMKIRDMVLILDDTTIDRLTQASSLIDKARERGVPLEVIDWELTKGTFVSWPVDLVQEVAFEAGMHIQRTFSHQKALYVRIRACGSAGELAAIDLEDVWPNQ